MGLALEVVAAVTAGFHEEAIATTNLSSPRLTGRHWTLHAPAHEFQSIVVPLFPSQLHPEELPFPEHYNLIRACMPTK